MNKNKVICGQVIGEKYFVEGYNEFGTVFRCETTAQLMVGVILQWVVNNETPETTKEKYGVKNVRRGRGQQRRAIKRSRSESQVCASDIEQDFSVYQVRRDLRHMVNNK